MKSLISSALLIALLVLCSLLTTQSAEGNEQLYMSTPHKESEFKISEKLNGVDKGEKIEIEEKAKIQLNFALDPKPREHQQETDLALKADEELGKPSIQGAGTVHSNIALDPIEKLSSASKNDSLCPPPPFAYASFQRVSL